MFDVQFNSTNLPVENALQVKKWDAKKKAENKAQIKKWMKPSDEKFAAYKKEHGFVFCMISALTFLVSFKYNKMYYSHFYSFGMFKANWSDENHYRKIHTWYTMIHMFLVDLGLIVIGIAGLISVDFMANQLYITFIETVVLSIIDIVLGAIELYKLKEYLAYTGKSKTAASSRAKVSNALIDDDDDPAAKKKAGLSAFYNEFD